MEQFNGLIDQVFGANATTVLALLKIIGINIVLAVGLNIVKGFAGQVTVGHIALMAIGGYASAVISVNFGVPFWGALPLAMLVCAGAGVLGLGMGDGEEGQEQRDHAHPSHGRQPLGRGPARPPDDREPNFFKPL